jgi:aminopeptidase
MIGVGIVVVLLVIGLLAVSFWGRRRGGNTGQPALIGVSAMTQPESSQSAQPAAAPTPSSQTLAAETSPDYSVSIPVAAPQPSDQHPDSAAGDFDRTLDTYADLLLRVGVNLQQGQPLVIGTPGMGLIDVADFIRRLASRAWDLGAGDVQVLWGDDTITRLRLQHASEELLGTVPPWDVQRIESFSSNGAAFLIPMAPNPTALEGVDPERLAIVQRASAAALRHFSERMGQGKVAWTGAALATPAWARHVFPELDESAGMSALWDYLIHVMRLDTPDPVVAWKQHLARLNERATYLNTAHFKALHYHGPGTDLTIELPELHRWISGGMTSERGVFFVANMPTEEVFTTPRRDGVNGVVRSTKPLSVGGMLIENFGFTFANGRIVDFTAEKGYEVLKTIVETDEGSHYLGEVSLVPHGSPCDIERPLYNTLFDENAACHLAIGRCIEVSVVGGEDMGPDELAAAGANISNTHIDFMVGSGELDIEGETASGERVPLLNAGSWLAPTGSE